MSDRSVSPPSSGEALERPADERRRAARERKRLETEIDRLQALVVDRTERLAQARAESARLKADPAIARLLAVRSRARSISRRIRRAPAIVAARLGGRRSPGDADRRTAEAWLRRLPRTDVARRIVAAQGPAASQSSPCPTVSIILSVPGGAAPGPAWIDSLAATAWPELEWLIATDLADRATNAAAEQLARVAGWRSQVVIGKTAAAAIENALALAYGAYVVFLQTNLVPAEPGWLGRLVAGAEETAAAAASPRIIGLADRGPADAGPGTPSILLLGRGIAFRPGPGLPVPEPLGRGEDPFGQKAGETAARVVPGHGGLLVRHGVIADLALPPIGDLAELAVELGLRLRERGHNVAYVGSAVLWRRDDLSTAGGDTGSVWSDLHSRWGPRLHREVWRDALGGPREWASRPLRAAIIAGGDARQPLGRQIAEGLREHGWWVAEPGTEAGAPPDVLVVLDPAADLGKVPRHVVRIGWVAEDDAEWAASAWFDDLDLVVSGSLAGAPVAVGGRRVARLREPADLHRTVADWLGRTRFALHIGPADWTAAEHWGDTPFARAVARQLELLGNPSSVVVFEERDDPVALRADVALHIVGTRRLPLRPAQLNLLWIISHPDAVRSERCAAYDLVFVASDPFLEHLSEQVEVPVVSLHQATDPARFRPAPGGPGHELLFVGNSRNRHRPVLDALAGTDRDLAVYGGNWRPELLEPRYLCGEWIPNDEVHRYYASAAIVLNDHWADMRDEGFISNRIYDVLASGGFVLTDPVVGLDAEFDGAVAIWTDANDLRASIERYLSEPELRRAKGERGRAAVLARHTFAHRAATLVAAARPLWESRPAWIGATAGAAGTPAMEETSGTAGSA